MIMASTVALPHTIPSVSGVNTPTIHPTPAALVAATAAVNDASNHNQKDTTFTKIFVGGLPYHTTDKSLREHFEVYGEIDEAVVITDRQTGKSRGYGFVTMADRSGADRAIKDPNPVIDGRKANVNLAYLGAKPRGAPGSGYATSVLTGASPSAAMRLYAQIPGAPPHFGICRQSPCYDGDPSSLQHYVNWNSSYAAAHAAGNYLYTLPTYPFAHTPTALVPAQTAAHLTPSQAAAAAAAVSVGYSPAEYAGTAGYTTAGFTQTPTVIDPYTMNQISGATLPPSSYSYLAHAAAANPGSTFTIGAGYPPAGATQQAAALQEARMP
ncbi:UNVERIFIED_CONTAM: hypothetical protein RMT77_016193 [Armadillidium vulgare]